MKKEKEETPKPPQPQPVVVSDLSKFALTDEQREEIERRRAERKIEARRLKQELGLPDQKPWWEF